MLLFLLLIVSEILTLAVLRQHFYDRSWMSYYFCVIVHVALSIWIWILWFETITYNGIFDEPGHIWIMMSLAGMICAVVLPRLMLAAFHFGGRLIRRKTGGHSRALTNTGLVLFAIIITVLGMATFYGRFNFKTENYTLKIKGLKTELSGLKIVQISDMHLSSFYHHKELLENAMKQVSAINPDILINTGDFVTIGWRESKGLDSVLRIPEGKFGSFAVMGNHDFGTYDPFFTEADRDNNVLLMNRFIRSSGYTLLNDESSMLNIGDARIAMIGIITKGSFPRMIHGDLQKAVAGTDSADLRVLLSHDPNSWDKEVAGKTNIEVTFSGHTHGMQIGILTKKFRWSPAKFFYPHWEGVYREGDQFLVVNRGLGVLAIPFRIWMPPEITVVTILPG
jgi:predicted MPP superfamily phosphohydrolase